MDINVVQNHRKNKFHLQKVLKSYVIHNPESPTFPIIKLGLLGCSLQALVYEILCF